MRVTLFLCKVRERKLCNVKWERSTSVTDYKNVLREIKGQSRERLYVDTEDSSIDFSRTVSVHASFAKVCSTDIDSPV